MLATIHATAGRMSAFGVRFARHRGGAAAVEFGLLAPLLLLMLLATIEIGRAVNADRHFIAAVGTAAISLRAKSTSANRKRLPSRTSRA